MAVHLGSGKVEKEELIRIQMRVDGKAYARHSQAISALPLTKPIKGKVEKSDVLNVDYTLTAQYIGNVAKALEAVKELCSDPDIIVTASCADLMQGRILFYEALKRLEAIIKEVEKRD